MTITDPEQYPLPPTNNVPNNPLPALVYRNVLPTPYTSESAKQLCESHGWEKRLSYKAHPASSSAVPDLSTVSKAKEAWNST
ncbi:hypothetical protein SNOG_05440 [Parastagonospora nodorum SN15]|uniref:Uncharacterized protein n=1 Tax=Phaeosphaeria nodorum (strain SN15 / ATCC MYA-4574 / FGSC 10173) TaxID=321614 RepID=Q0US24_PHANO|nr:hypothetical protein SNOG_05440 [Parastagonospora nodorum SN15]EAT87831.1 hypothetical protein SNOG_05440 [Parastagonospora nodorum SN15]